MSSAQFGGPWGSVPSGFWGIGRAYGYGIGHDFPDRPKRKHKKRKR